MSVPSTARAASVTVRTAGVGSAEATESAAEPARVTAPHPIAAADQPAASTGLASSRRKRFISEPVLMSTGHAVWHMPSTAQVCTPS